MAVPPLTEKEYTELFVVPEVSTVPVVTAVPVAAVHLPNPSTPAVSPETEILKLSPAVPVKTILLLLSMPTVRPVPLPTSALVIAVTFCAAVSPLVNATLNGVTSTPLAITLNLTVSLEVAAETAPPVTVDNTAAPSGCPAILKLPSRALAVYYPRPPGRRR